MTNVAAAPLRLTRPTTRKEHERTWLDSSIRLAESEDAIVAEVARQPAGVQLPYVGAIANGAVARMDAEFQTLPPGKKPFVYPVFQHERRLIETLNKEHPPSAELQQRAKSLLDQLSAQAMSDELAAGALIATRYFCSRYRCGW